MKARLLSSARLLYAGMALTILVFAAGELHASRTAVPCDQPPLTIGTCPGDYDNDLDCRTACIEEYMQFDGYCADGCCHCVQ